MQNKRTKWGVRILFTFIVLFLVTLSVPPLPRQKARPQRIQAVNRIDAVTFTMAVPSTNAVPAPEYNQ